MKLLLKTSSVSSTKKHRDLKGMKKLQLYQPDCVITK